MDNRRARRSTFGPAGANYPYNIPSNRPTRLSEPGRVASGDDSLSSISTPLRQTTRGAHIATPGSSTRRRRARTNRRLSSTRTSPRTPIGRRSMEDLRRSSLGRRLSWVIDPNAQTKRYSAGGDLKMLARLMYKEKEVERANKKLGISSNDSTHSAQGTTTPSKTRSSSGQSPSIASDGSARRPKQSSRLSLSRSLTDDIMDNIAIPEGVIREEGDFSTRFDDDDNFNAHDIDGVSGNDMFDDLGVDGDEEDDYGYDREEEDGDDSNNDYDDANLSLVMGARRAKALKAMLPPGKKRRVTFGGDAKAPASSGPVVVPIPRRMVRQSVDLLLPKSMRKNLSDESIQTLIQLTRQFTKQQADDLIAYSNHRKKVKSITIADALLLLNRAKLEFEDDLLNFSLGSFLDKDYLDEDLEQENENESAEESDTEESVPSETLESKIFSMAQHVYNLEDIIKVESILNIPRMKQKRNNVASEYDEIEVIEEEEGTTQDEDGDLDEMEEVEVEVDEDHDEDIEVEEETEDNDTTDFRRYATIVEEEEEEEEQETEDNDTTNFSRYDTIVEEEEETEDNDTTGFSRYATIMEEEEETEDNDTTGFSKFATIIEEDEGSRTEEEEAEEEVDEEVEYSESYDDNAEPYRTYDSGLEEVEEGQEEERSGSSDEGENTE